MEQLLRTPRFRLGCLTIALMWLLQVVAISLALIWLLPLLPGISFRGGPWRALLLALLLSIINIGVRLLAALWCTLVYSAIMLLARDLSDPQSWAQSFQHALGRLLEPFRRSRLVAWLAISWPMMAVAFKVLADLNPNVILVENWEAALAGSGVISAIAYLLSTAWLVRRKEQAKQQRNVGH